MNVSSLLRIAVSRIRNNAPLLLTATAITGVVSTAVLAAKASPVAADRISEETHREGRGLDAVEKVRLTWTLYLPAVASGGLTIASIVLMHHTHKKRYAALMGVYALGQKAFDEYRESVDEIVSNKDKQRIKETVSKKAVEREEDGLENHVRANGDLQVVFDTFSGRYFKSDLESVRSAENDFNSGLIRHDYGTLNELYSLMGLEGVGAGEDIGWNSDKLLAIGYNAILTEKGIPVICLDFHESPPTYDFYQTK